jgi:aminopeptidase N
MKASLLLFSAAVLAIHLSSCSREVPPNEAGVSLQLAEFRKSLITDIRYTLFFSIPENRRDFIDATVSIRFSLTDDGADIPLDFRESPEHLQSLTINGSAVPITFENEHILLPAEHLTPGENIVDIAFVAGESSLNRNPDYLYTLFVPDRARTAFPLFDQPDLKAVFELTLEIPESWQAISNAEVESIIEMDSTHVMEFAPSDRFSSYLFSFVAGNFESVTRTVGGVEMTMLHRETDTAKVERNLDAVFDLHASSLQWLEEYTGIDYPFQKFDFALIPSFQYGGMEHTGAIQYRAGSLFLDEDPSESQLLSRASLIAHETAHMWFGNFVTMKWFNDVWTKEVFANFMAAKMVNPDFPDINHDLNFMLRHHPSAYSVDRTEGANAIRQHLPNLNEAGQMYGAIIYNKAPIMMRQLELLTGEDLFRDGMREYLDRYAFENATWPDLINILDQKTEKDLEQWSEVWVNSPGRPHLEVEPGQPVQVRQADPSGENRIWPQQFTILENQVDDHIIHSVHSESERTAADFDTASTLVFNENGHGYGLFPGSVSTLSGWEELGDRAKGAELINIYENILEGVIEPEAYFTELQQIIQAEENQLLLNRSLAHLETLYWNLITQKTRSELGPKLESIVWNQMLQQPDATRKKIFFNTFRNIALSDDQVEKIYEIWSGERTIDGLNLSESDYISMAGDLAVKEHRNAEEILSTQLERIEDEDRKRRFEYILPALSDSPETRADFFESLKEAENRHTESWVLGALGYLHHPLRVDESERYILPSLELLQEIQVTSDIFFPSRWLDASYTPKSLVGRRRPNSPSVS